MRHWIFTIEGRALPSWLEALPQAKVLGRDEICTVDSAEPGILWFRLRSGEALGDVLPQISLADLQHIVVLCDDPDEAIVMQSMAAGAAGCCNSFAAPDVLRQVALVVGNGGLWIGQALLQRLVDRTSRILSQRPAAMKNDDWSAKLSEREAQVARLVAGGASNKEIARDLSIAERTVKAHLTAVFEKLGLRDRLQLSLRINGLTI